MTVQYPVSLETLTTPVWIYDLRAHRVLWANPAALDLWDAESLEELTARGFLSGLTPAVRQRLEIMEERLHAGERLVETWTMFPRHEAVTISCVLSGLRLDDGSLAMQVEARRVDDEQVLRDRRSVEALQHASTLFILINAEGHMVSCNPMAASLFPQVMVEPLRPVVEVLPVEDAVRAELGRAILDGVCYAGEVRMQTADGIRWMALDARPLPDPLTGRTLVMVSMTDISERRRLEEERLHHEEALRAIVEAAPIPLVVTRLIDARLLYANAQAGHLFGMPSELLSGQETHGYYLRASDRAYLREVLAEQERVDDWQVSLTTGDGRPFAASVSARLISYHGEPAILAAVVDIEADTEARRVLSQALDRQTRLNEAHRQFVSMLSHEFMTPVSVIDGAARRINRLLAKGSPAEDIHPWAQRIQAAVARISELVSDVLVSAKTDDGLMRLSPEDMDVSDVLGRIAERHRRIAADHQIRLTVEGAGPHLFLDGKVLDIVLSNLLSNAIKYSPDGGAIHVDAKVDAGEDTGDGTLSVAVSDQGMGIPEDEQARIFDRFYRCSTTAGITGTGLGLDITRRLVLMHGGDLTVDSQPGHGSVFRFTLAAAKP